MQINIPLNPQALDGYKVYAGVAAAAVVIIANHFGVLPPQYAPAHLDPNDWVWQLYGLYMVAAHRSAMKKQEGKAVVPPSKS